MMKSTPSLKIQRSWLVCTNPLQPLQAAAYVVFVRLQQEHFEHMLDPLS